MMMVSHPAIPWLAAAQADIGLREVQGAPTAPRIAQWLRDLRAWWTDDETPWCGTACAAWMRAAGIAPPAAWYRALEWVSWGQPLSAPLLGCVVVFERQGGGHVGLVAGQDTSGRLLVLGGNQGNAVSVAPFEQSRVLAYRWPAGSTAAQLSPPVFASAAASSRNEA